MNPKASNSDHPMNSFMFGLTLGILGTLLLGTEEGRKLANEVMDSLPEHLRHLGQKNSGENYPDFAPPILSPEETPHHEFYSQEAPPPPPPTITNRPDYLFPKNKS